jgi:hypothetical protein
MVKRLFERPFGDARSSSMSTDIFTAPTLCPPWRAPESGSSGAVQGLSAGGYRETADKDLPDVQGRKTAGGVPALNQRLPHERRSAPRLPGMCAARPHENRAATHARAARGPQKIRAQPGAAREAAPCRGGVDCEPRPHARTRARSACVFTGRLTRPAACQIKGCAATKRLVAHHHSYQAALEVLWCCRRHHRLLHLGVLPLKAGVDRKLRRCP